MTPVLADFDDSGTGGRRMVVTLPFELEEGDWSEQFDSAIVELVPDGADCVDIVFFDGRSTRMYEGDEFVVFRS